MYAGKLVFAQMMEFAPWHTFRRLVGSTRVISTSVPLLAWTSFYVWPLPSLHIEKACAMSRLACDPNLRDSNHWEYAARSAAAL